MRKYIILAAVALVLSCGCQASAKERKTSASVSDISPAMFKLIGKLPELHLEGNDVDLGPTIKSMTGFYMLQTEDSSLADKISKDVSKTVKSQKFELLMEVKDKGEKVNIFSLGDKELLKSLVLTAIDGNETTFISIDGLMRREDVEKAIGQLASKSL